MEAHATAQIVNIANRAQPAPLRTRIREFRKLRGMTLKDLADKINTTPQTAQRLETDNMTCSIEWLEKIAKALMVEVSDLVGKRQPGYIPFLGHVVERGHIAPLDTLSSETFQLEAPADDPVAVRLRVAVGTFEAGTVLIANRLREDDLDNALGCDCIIELASGAKQLRRVLRGVARGADRTFTLVPLYSGGDALYNAQIRWAARILMAVRFL